MHHLFVQAEQLYTDYVHITGEDYHHIRNVLRMRPGEKVMVCVGDDREYECSIVGFDMEAECVILQVEDVFGSARELPAKITLFQGYPKKDKLEMIVQKAVELGVSEIVPVMMKRCVVKLDERKSAQRVERLNSIALGAAKQSKRGRIPEVTKIMSMAEACEYATQMDYVIVPYENAEGMVYAKEIIRQAADKKHIGVFIGPEGGFEASEVNQIEAVGGKTISLGHRILRTETAGLTILSLLMFLLERD
ncbi:MAG: 16S rRNA (uracil(1498)-N(3))-methyltransferase [Lachnospiraceae bacterium]|nr:16S rRNA (uracil(1498)-N(3))-methyltransferase [Lachnospiraceae bacterium]MDE6625713.1 16S rRNA (uracil(1498)-N(3))-methyltransferase [Lachnospiraceae bacterium]